MPLWRCPHCGIPQAETSRCWVCHQSTTSCGTCRHFRRGVANGLGLCGLDPRRGALSGTEIQACWEASVPATHEAAAPGSTGLTLPTHEPAHRAPRTFVPVDELVAAGVAGRTLPPVASPPPAAPAPTVESRPAPGWSLWGDLDP